MTNFLTVKNPDAEAEPNELEYRRKGKDMATQAQYDKLIEDNELAFFRADVCLGSPESCSLEEKAAICEDMEASTAEVEAALRADFESLPPHGQAMMLDMLQKADPENFGWWKEILLGAMPGSVDELTEEAQPC